MLWNLFMLKIYIQVMVLKVAMVVEFNLRILENGKIYKVSMNLN